MEPNEIWAYRETGKHPLEPVRFLRHRRNTNKSNAHAQIRFEDADADGLETWVPTGRLKCLWADAEAFTARELRWAELRRVSMVGEDVEHAAAVVLDALTPLDVLGSSAGAGGTYEYAIKDVSTLSRLCGIPEIELTSAPTAFEEDGNFMVPFQTAERVARALAGKHPEAVLRVVVREERDLEEKQLEWRQRGSPPRGEQSEDWDEALRRSFEIRREWVGAEANTFQAEVLASHGEVQELRDLVEYAAKFLQANGHTTVAAKLRRSLKPNDKPE
ncbi:hypothetical protein SAMN04487914_13253 [Arthrobacter sp. ok909]|uniref:hypothetical protein n=1 Tax=Arthrobacter sp. ok909 TaxID=1761746 RepID=UPI00088DC174|nr:hypothetical protein [Arthrobacter sp. ok909]SDP74229.1 hypothetical protein SAMN04487914_13253 [Arthrobacter sp. ok909]